MDNVTAGDTIIVRDGTYNETVDVVDVTAESWIFLKVSYEEGIQRVCFAPLGNVTGVNLEINKTDSDVEDTTVFAIPVCVKSATGTGIACFDTDSGTIEDLVAVHESALPDIVPVGTQYWKYHASEGGWIRIQMGSDYDDIANGVIVDIL